MKANLTLACSTSVQEEVRAFLMRYFDSLPISASEKNQIILAIDEALANAIIHGNKADESKSITLDMDVTDKRISLEIYDVGLFDATAQGEESKNVNLKEVIKERQKGGLGLKLIYSIMDVVCFYTKDDKSYCLLVKMFKT